MSDVSYFGFGPKGETFELLERARRQSYRNSWEEFQSSWSWEQAVTTFYRTSGFWYDQFGLLISLALRHQYPLESLKRRLPTLWEELRRSFTPALDSWESTALNPSFLEGISAVSRCFFSGLRVLETQEVLPISFASFNEQELDYIRGAHPHVFEAGGGSGYLALELQRRGVDIVSVDDGRFEQAYDLSAPWYQESVERGILHRADARSCTQYLGAERSLLIAWPEPGTSMLSELMRIHRERGGRHLLLKLGLYFGAIGTADAGSEYRAPENPVANILSFLEELSVHWVQLGRKDTPPYEPLSYVNNLWVFEVRS